jgi:hypothetical protein
MDAAKCRGLLGFWMKWGRVRDMDGLAYPKHKGICDFFWESGSCQIRGVYWFVSDMRGMSGVMWWPGANTNSLLVSSRDFKFGVGDKGI